MSSLELARAAYRDISLYAVDRTPCAIDLSDNTNLFGIPPSARRELQEVATSTVTRYPPLYSGALKAELAKYIGVSPEQVTTGCGSDDVLDSAIRAFAEPGDKLAFPDPTFAMVPIFAKMNGLVPMPVPLRPNWDLDAEALLATGARVFYVCSPNNPTSTMASRGELDKLVANAKGAVILDEAYGEFARERWAPEAPSRPTLLVVRTMSKAFGLAGLRVGYAVGSPKLIAEVEKSRGPYKVNAVAERAAVAALREDRDWVQRGIETVIANRSRFEAELRSLGFDPIPSSANFVLFAVKDAVALTKAMRSLGVAVRPFTKLPRIGDALRISIGPWELMEATLSALRKATA